ncbi:btk-binding protein-related [Anaeramoeba flamelloides]|uniref:Btk-binding protein-related n=1 Tax=Anaeramoeba flamelloides TaxID=1746091 RepID=A0ABQ8Z4E3_9EUKA|nr:btk-binding protein-related [Anaeramoeba flamelloides]
MTEKITKKLFYQVTELQKTKKNVQMDNVVLVSQGDRWSILITEEGNVYESNGSLQNINKVNVSGITCGKSGFTHYLLLSSESTVYGRGAISENFGQIGMGKNKSCGTPEPIPFFEELKNKEDVEVEMIYVSCYNSYYYLSDGRLFASGYNPSGQLGTVEVGVSQFTPKLIGEKVSRVWTDNLSYFIWFETSDGTITGSGPFENSSYRTTFQQLKIEKEDLFDIACSFNHSLIVTQPQTQDRKDKVAYNAYAVRKVMAQTPIKWLFDHPIAEISGGNQHSIVRLEDDSLFWVKNSGTYVKIQFEPVRLDVGKKLSITSGWGSSTVYIGNEGDENQKRRKATDFMKLYEEKKFVDFEIYQGINVHRVWIEWRLKTDSKKIQQIISTWEEEKIQSLISWAYSGIYRHRKAAQAFGEAIQRNELPATTVSQDLERLYKMEETKDFHLLIPEEADEEGEEEEEEEEKEEEELVEIPVHKFILIGRCGLFREMFENVTEQKNSVKDYSGKTVESIEIFIKFLYTNKIELTADDDPQLVVEELENAAEYYQLDTPRLLSLELNKIIKQFNL